MANWQRRILTLARHIAAWSKDSSTQCGCVITGPDNEIRATGYNGLPRGVDLYEDEAIVAQRPEKYFWFEHAERNAIYNAARIGTALDECTAYVTGPVCADCGRALIQAGIRNIFIPEHHNFGKGWMIGERWMDSCRRAKIMCEHAGVNYEVLKGV